MRSLKVILLFFILAIQTLNAQQIPAKFVIEVYDDIYHAMQTRQSPEKPTLLLADNPKEIALFTPGLNQIEIGQDFIDFARRFGKDSVNVIAQIISHELAHVLLEQSTIIKNIGSGYASKEFNKRLRKTHVSLRDHLFERQADEYSFFYSQIAGYQTADIAPQILDSIYKQWNFKDRDLKRYPPLAERKLIAKTASKKMIILKDFFDVAVLANISGKYNLAINLFKFILEEDFDSREIHNNLGTAYLMKSISKLDTIKYPYFFPVQMDLNTELDSERGMGENVKGDIKKALEQFRFSCEGQKIYPIPMLNKAICEWLLEDDEFEISLFRLSKINDNYIQSQVSLLEAIHTYHKKKDLSLYRDNLEQLRASNLIADANYQKFFGNKTSEVEEKKEFKFPELQLPNFNFIFDDEAKKSDTLNKIFGPNAKHFSIRKLENKDWKGVRVKFKGDGPPIIMTVFSYNLIDKYFDEDEVIRSDYETKQKIFVFKKNCILEINKNNLTKRFYKIK